MITRSQQMQDHLRRKIRPLLPTPIIWARRFYKLEGDKALSVLYLLSAASSFLEGCSLSSQARADVSLAASEI